MQVSVCTFKRTKFDLWEDGIVLSANNNCNGDASVIVDAKGKALESEPYDWRVRSEVACFTVELF